MKSYIGLKMSLGFGVALLILGLIGAVSYYSTRQFMGTVNWMAHTDRILDSLEQVLSHAKDIDIGVRGYLLTGEERYLEPYHTALAGIDQPLQDLLDLTMHHPQRHLQITSFRDMIATRKALASELVDLWRIEVGKGSTSLTIEQLPFTEALSPLGREPDHVARLLFLIRAGKQVMDEMRTQVRQIKHAENALLQQHRGAAEARARSTKAVIIAGSSFALLCVALAGYVVQRDLTGRRRAEETAERLRRHTALIPEEFETQVIGLLNRMVSRE